MDNILYKICSLISYNNNFFSAKDNNKLLFINIPDLNIIKEQDFLNNNNTIEYYLKVIDDYTLFQKYSDNIITKYYNMVKSDIILINLENINTYFLELLDFLSKKN
jgi:hypothetical protein